MHKNSKLKTIKPFIFTKILKDHYKIISFNKIISTLGLMRYFPPTTQEWYNSIYSYNNNYIKNIVVADKSLSILIKSYFNLYFKDKLLSNKHVNTRFRRLAINKVFVSKAELKHTNSKVIITLYLYNEERRILLNRIKRIETILFCSIKQNSFREFNKNFSLKEKLNIIKLEKENISFKFLLDELMLSISKKKKKEKNILLTVKSLEHNKEKELYIKTLEEKKKYLLIIISSIEKNSFTYKHYFNIYEKYINKTLLEKEIIIIAYYKLLLNLNMFKLEDKFLFSLKHLIGKIYNKEVEFNLVNLKTIYLNSDIYTQVISLKLKNRNNGLLRVLRSFLYTVRLPKIDVIKERFNYINPKNL